MIKAYCDKCKKEIAYPYEHTRNPKFLDYYIQVDLCGSCIDEWEKNLKPKFEQECNEKIMEATREVEQEIYKYFGIKELIEDE